MNQLGKILLAGGVCAAAWSMTALASTNLETSSSLAGITVAMNNYYASNEEPEKSLSEAIESINFPEIVSADSGGGEESQAASASETSKALQETSSSAYDNIAISKISGHVNIRSEANTSSQVLGKIYNDSAATILDTVQGEDGTWYQIQSGSVTGYIKAEYFVTGKEAEQKAQSVGTEYGTVVGTPTLRLRQSPDLTSKTLTLLSEGASYVVLEEQGDFLKVAVDSDLEGYVYKEYMKTEISMPEAVSNEEEEAQKAEEEKRRQEAEEAIKELEEAKKAEAQKASEAAETQKETQKETTRETTEETRKETTAAQTVGTIAANPEEGEDGTVAAPTTQKATEKENEKETEKTTESGKGPGSSSSSVDSATRNAVVAYAKQFLGNPYKYGGTSLTDGADCSGFVMSVFSHFGISTGRSSRDQAGRGKEIDVSEVQPGDLLFYASGGYINHVGIYIGGGQIIHASNPSTGICLAPSNYRTPCKAVTFF